MRTAAATIGVLLVWGLSLGFPGGALAAGTPPVIESRSVDLASGETILEADINPGGLDTAYQFWLVFHDPCFDFTPPCLIPEELIPLPEGHLKASEASQHVSLDLESLGLDLGSGTYDFGLSATNAAGSSWATGERFTAIPPGGEPLPEPRPEPGGGPADAATPTPTPPDQPTPPPPVQGPVEQGRKPARCRRPARASGHMRRHHHHRSAGKACSRA